MIVHHMHSFRIRPLLLAATAGLLPPLTPAMAQTPVDAAPPATLEEITVTAQRREETLQSVPIQVTALSATTIANAGIRSTSTALQLVPNVQFDESFTYLNSFITVRGISQINNADPPVAVVVDGVAQNSQKQLRMELFDIERIEVLKGPQGGLYGRNALGGAINIVTKTPANAFEGEVSGGYGRGDAVNVTAAASGALVPDKVLVRVSGSYLQDNGRIRNSFTGRKVDFVNHDYDLRGRVDFRLTEALSIDVRGSYRGFSAGSIYDAIVDSGDANDIRAPRSNITGLTFGHVTDVSGRISYDFGGATLSSVTAYTDLVERYRGDLDFSNPVQPASFLGGLQLGQGQNLRTQLTSQELRLASSGGGPFHWIAGVYYLHTDRRLDTLGFLDFNGRRDQIDNPAQVILSQREDNDNDAYAVYGQADYDLTDALNLSAALRYDRDDRRQTNLVTGAERQRRFDRVQPKVTLTYKFDADRLAYATYSTGFRSGGFNAPLVVLPVFRAETLQNYEAGFKTSWLGRRLSVNGAIYLERDRNFQFFIIDATTASQIIANIDRVNIWGVELEAQALLAPGITVNAALGTTDSSIRRNQYVAGTVGNKAPRTVPWTLNLGAQYLRPIAGEYRLLLRADYKHLARKYWQVDNVAVQDPVDLLSLRAGIETDRFGVYVAGANVFNERYYADYNPSRFSGLPYDIGFRAQPATYRVEAKLKF